MFLGAAEMHSQLLSLAIPDHGLSLLFPVVIAVSCCLGFEEDCLSVRDAVQIMAALIIVESAIKPAYLKPSWRLWAFPAPNPALAGMFSQSMNISTLCMPL